ncbi:MAG: hypothetical protein AABY22_01075, partial [Nanoarchaeota archaeon]
MQKLVKRYTHVWVGNKKIALDLRYCERQIKRFSAKFHSLGFIQKLKRPYCTNLYFMDESLINIDVNNPAFFYRRNVPKNVPISVSTNKEKNTYTAKGIGMGLKNPSIHEHLKEIKNPAYQQPYTYTFPNKNAIPQPKNPYIYPHLEGIPLKEDEKMRLSTEFSEYQIV